MDSIDKFISIEDKLPQKGKDIVGINDNGEQVHCFRCACGNDNCIEWRSPFGGAILTVITKWKYDI